MRGASRASGEAVEAGAEPAAGSSSTAPRQRILSLLPDARAPASVEEARLVPTRLRRVIKGADKKERSSQCWNLEAQATGKDFAGVAATGSGKSLIWLAYAAADARDALDEARQAGRADVTLAPITLVVVPLIAMGAPHEEEANQFLLDSCRDLLEASWAAGVWAKAPYGRCT
jgi:superfamily II DNA helicase RecQ